MSTKTVAKAGSLVKVSGLDEVFKVISVTEVDGIRKFELFSLEKRQLRTLYSPPKQITPLLQPLDLILNRDFDDPTKFNLFVESKRLLAMHLYDPLLSLSTTRIDVLPHQVEAVHRMLKTYWPHFLLADDEKKVDPEEL